MAEPPHLGSDPLSRFLKDAEYNARVTAANYPVVFQFLGRIHATLQRAEEAVEKDSQWIRLVPRFLLIRTHSSVLAAIRAGMSGQAAEAFPLLRSAIEQSWYALHMASEPDSDSRVQIWLRRNEDDAATARCKSEFTVKNVRSTHEARDASSAAEMQRIYEMSIDHGAHPNQMGVFSGMSAMETATQVNYKVGILTASEQPVMVSLRLAAAVAIGALKTFRLIYSERFAMVGLDDEITGLVQELNLRFKQFASTSRTS